MDKPPKETLLQYEEAQELVGKTHRSLKKGGNISTGRAKKAHLPPLESKPQPDDILHAILPPRYFADKMKTFVQYCSTMPASRSDVTKLKEALEEKLQEREALSAGLWPVRQDLYGQTFDELIRHITLDCPERGLLLVRIRDDSKMTKAAYRTLMTHCTEYVMAKSLAADKGKQQEAEIVEELRDRKERLERRKQELLHKKELLINEIEERKIEEDIERKAEVEYLDYQGKNMDAILKNTDIS